MGVAASNEFLKQYTGPMTEHSDPSVAERLAAGIVALEPGVLPAGVRQTCEALLVDVIGLAVGARAM